MNMIMMVCVPKLFSFYTASNFFLRFVQDVSELRSWMFGEENLTRKDIVVQPSVHEQEDG